MTPWHSVNMKAVWQNVVVAESNDTIEVEGNIYFPPGSINEEFFVESKTRTICPWKGQANYFTLRVNGEEKQDAAWFYPDPKQTAHFLKGLVAFWKGVEIRS